MSSVRENVLKKFRQKLSDGKKIIISGVGTGLISQLSEEAGVDALMVLSASLMRNQGRSSLGSYLPFFNSNSATFELFVKFIHPSIGETPVIVGLFGSDPTTDFPKLLSNLLELGVQGVVNYPAVSLLDGQFREAVEESGLGIEREAEMLGLARDMGFLTIGFVCTRDEAQVILDQDVDLLSVHLGLTTGGKRGAKKAYSLIAAKDSVNTVLNYATKRKEDIIRILAGGAILSHNDLQFMYQNTHADGFVGGSSFERRPLESAVTDALKLFLTTTSLSSGQKTLDYQLKKETPDPIQEVKNYVAENYHHNIAFTDLCKITNTSRTHLSSMFSHTVGMSFREYLINYRMNIAAELLQDSELLMGEVAELVSYYDYPQFSKIFKKYYGVSPTQYRINHTNSLVHNQPNGR